MYRLPIYRLLIVCATAVASLSHAATYSISGQAGAGHSGRHVDWRGFPLPSRRGPDARRGRYLTVVSPAGLRVPAGSSS